MNRCKISVALLGVLTLALLANVDVDESLKLLAVFVVTIAVLLSQAKDFEK